MRDKKAALTSDGSSIVISLPPWRMRTKSLFVASNVTPSFELGSSPFTAKPVPMTERSRVLGFSSSPTGSKPASRSTLTEAASFDPTDATFDTSRESASGELCLEEGCVSAVSPLLLGDTHAWALAAADASRGLASSSFSASAAGE